MKPSAELLQTSKNDANEHIEINDKPLDFDKILRFEIGEYGLYQLLVGISTGLCAAFGTIIIMNFVFGVAIPDHR